MRLKSEPSISSRPITASPSGPENWHSEGEEGPRTLDFFCKVGFRAAL